MRLEEILLNLREAKSGSTTEKFKTGVQPFLAFFSRYKQPTKGSFRKKIIDFQIGHLKKIGGERKISKAFFGVETGTGGVYCKYQQPTRGGFVQSPPLQGKKLTIKQLRF